MEKVKIIFAGAVVGLLGVLLVLLGNPANMGICLACFLRDISGGLGFHRAAVVQYLRPEISGFILGSFISAFAAKEFKPRGGSSPAVRFFIAVFVMIGALVFLGCPLRMLFRMSAGDLNAWIALPGFIFGIYAGIFFLRRGYSLGKSSTQPKANGFLLPLLAVILLVFLLIKPTFIFFSQEGPGSMTAPAILALAAGLIVGIAAQRTRLCTAGGFRDIILLKDFHLASGIFSLFAAAFIANLIFGKFNLSFMGQPIAHADGLWNFLGMTLAGFGSILLGGCPLRQTILAGEGDSDAAITVLGLIVGAAVAHNFGLASSAAGVTMGGKAAVVIGFAFVLATAILNTSEINSKLNSKLIKGGKNLNA
ncbi:MAG: YedE family putative selenium transporter [Bacillota bacterium]